MFRGLYFWDGDAGDCLGWLRVRMGFFRFVWLLWVVIVRNGYNYFWDC